MKKDIWKKIIMVNSALWVVAATYFVYSCAVGLIMLDGRQFLLGLAIVGFLTISQIVFAFIGD